jgi:hypothetical protein
MTTINTQFWQQCLAKSELRVANVLKRGKSQAMARLNKAKAAYNRTLTGKPPCEWYDDTIPVTIAGIPASIYLTHYDPGYPTRLHGHPDDMHDGAGPEVSYIVCDRDGYEAGQWLLDKVPADFDREVLELLERVE